MTFVNLKSEINYWVHKNLVNNNLHRGILFYEYNKRKEQVRRYRTFNLILLSYITQDISWTFHEYEMFYYKSESNVEDT